MLRVGRNVAWKAYRFDSVSYYFQQYCDYPAATKVRRERADIELERGFHRFIWETIFSGVGNNIGILGE